MTLIDTDLIDTPLRRRDVDPKDFFADSSDGRRFMGHYGSPEDFAQALASKAKEATSFHIYFKGQFLKKITHTPLVV